MSKSKSWINKRREDLLTVNQTKLWIQLLHTPAASSLTAKPGCSSGRPNLWTRHCTMQPVNANSPRRHASCTLSVLQPLLICSHTSTCRGVVGGGGRPASQVCVRAERLVQPAKGPCLHTGVKPTHCSFSLILPLDLVPSLMCRQETTWVEAAGIKYYSGYFPTMQK